MGGWVGGWWWLVEMVVGGDGGVAAAAGGGGCGGSGEWRAHGPTLAHQTSAISNGDKAVFFCVALMPHRATWW